MFSIILQGMGIKRRLTMDKYYELRCPKCNRLLMKYKLSKQLAIEIKCNNCKTISEFPMDLKEIEK